MSLLKQTSLDDAPEPTKSSSAGGREGELWCFSMPYDSEAKVVILDEGSPPCIDAVEIYDKATKTMYRYAVLSSEGKDCPFTNLYEETQDRRFHPKKFFLFAVLDMRGYKKRTGEEVPYSRKAMLVKSKQMDDYLRRKLAKYHDKNGTLRGSLWEVTRGPDKNPSPPSCGNDWDFSEMVDLSDYPESDIQPLSEEEIYTLFVTDPDELKAAAERWGNAEAEPKRASY